MTDGGPSREGGVGGPQGRWIREMVFRPERHHRSSNSALALVDADG